MKTIHTCPVGTAAIYKPECLSDCNDINCTACVFDTFRGRGDDCPFRRYITTYPVKRPIDTIGKFIKPKPLRKVDCMPEYLNKPINVLQDLRSEQDVLNMCATLQANTMQAQVEPLQDMVNVLDLIIEVTEKQDKLTKTQQELLVQEDKSDVPTWFMPSMENANDDVDGRDHYHHCPQKDNKLVRLIYVEEDKVHACPTCRRVFYLK